MGAVFGEFGGGEIDGEFAIGEGKPRVNQGGTDTLARFVDGFVGHADDIESGEPLITVALNGDEMTGVAIGDGRIYFCNHGSKDSKD